jgi:autophagy-related protein 9
MITLIIKYIYIYIFVLDRWNHIEDLDTFFTRIYLYHQRHGFICLILQSALDLLQVIFLLVFSLFLFYCIDYPVLFRYLKFLLNY